MTMMTIAICDDMQADARRLHKQLERIVPGSEIRIFKSGELLLEELEKVGALERKRQGLGRPNKLYLKKMF